MKSNIEYSFKAIDSAIAASRMELTSKTGYINVP